MQENDSTWRIDLSSNRKKSYLSFRIYRNAVATFFLHLLHACKTPVEIIFADKFSQVLEIKFADKFSQVFSGSRVRG